MENIVNVISSVGFPICMTLLLFVYMMKQNEMHREEVNTLKETIAQNTFILTQLKQLLEDKFND